MFLLKNDATSRTVIVDVARLEHDDELSGIRCPACGWRPSPSSRWSCCWTEGPEPFFESCSTVWNTFATRGRCPGCSHHWRWTSCLQCSEWSPHDDWYEQVDA